METKVNRKFCSIIWGCDLAGRIKFALIIAPKGVYRNWVTKEIPEHMSDDVPHRVIRWVSGPNKKQQEEMRSVKDPFNGLTIFVMNVESYSTRKGQVAGEWMANAYGSMGCIAIDESTTIKNHKAKRTKALLKISKRFMYKRLLTGSPITKSPWSFRTDRVPCPGLMGHESLFFQGRYAVVQRRTMGASFPADRRIQNLDELTDKIDRFSPCTQERLFGSARQNLHGSLRPYRRALKMYWIYKDKQCCCSKMVRW